MDTICDVRASPWSGEDVRPFASFLAVYAEFVLQRATRFGPGFTELMVRGVLQSEHPKAAQAASGTSAVLWCGLSLVMDRCVLSAVRPINSSAKLTI